MKFYQCPRCDARVFFENLACLSCHGELGYAPTSDIFLVNDGINEQQWQACGNRSSLGCNWISLEPQIGFITDAVSESATALCECCSFTTVIPPLDEPKNLVLWRNIERAKRYLFHSLIKLGLPLPTRKQDPEGGLAFHFLKDLPEQPVLTGHDAGVITINIAEADDVQRERLRISLHEPYRTLLGHLRHEIGHFYWDKLISGSTWHDHFRQLFGDESKDYAAALKSHYDTADDGKWQSNFVSRYASAHPWEDWAETWAHYLHIRDALDTAAHWEVSLAVREKQLAFKTMPLNLPVQVFKQQVFSQWLPLSEYLNAACRSLGEPDAYPYVLSTTVIEKISFIHGVVQEADVIHS